MRGKFLWKSEQFLSLLFYLNKNSLKTLKSSLNKLIYQLLDVLIWICASGISKRLTNFSKLLFWITNIGMVNLNDIERPQARVILFLVIILEVYYIVTKYYSGFSDYLTIIIIILSIPVAYYSYLYLAAKINKEKKYSIAERELKGIDAKE